MCALFDFIKLVFSLNKMSEHKNGCLVKISEHFAFLKLKTNIFPFMSGWRYGWKTTISCLHIFKGPHVCNDMFTRYCILCQSSY